MNKLTKWILAIALVVLVSILGFVWHKDSNTVLSLNGEKHITLNYGETYEDEGSLVKYRDKELETLLASHDDLDLEKVGTYTLDYEYKWLLKENTLTRTVEVVDKEPPKLKLKGDAEIKIKLDKSYKEPGFQAEDNYDGELNDVVEVKGEVNTEKEGTYELLYTVEDSSGNQSETKRVIEVYKPVVETPPSEGISKPGVIYLTFDDGPHGTRTDAILDILKSEGIKATFFVTGSGPDAPIKRLVNEGHTIALHTYSHVYSDIYASLDNYYKDLQKVSDRVENLTGIRSKLIRFPGGSSNTISKTYTSGIMSTLVQDVQSKGYIYHDWNVDSQDAAGNIGSQNVYRNTVNGLSKNYPNVVLMHDVHGHTVEALRDIIRYGKENGYTFEKMTESTRPIHHGVNN